MLLGNQLADSLLRQQQQIIKISLFKRIPLLPSPEFPQSCRFRSTQSSYPPEHLNPQYNPRQPLYYPRE